MSRAAFENGTFAKKAGAPSGIPRRAARRIAFGALKQGDGAFGHAAFPVSAPFFQARGCLEKAMAPKAAVIKMHDFLHILEGKSQTPRCKLSAGGKRVPWDMENYIRKRAARLSFLHKFGTKLHGRWGSIIKISQRHNKIFPATLQTNVFCVKWSSTYGFHWRTWRRRV